jgi:hypothetical protein
LDQSLLASENAVAELAFHDDLGHLRNFASLLPLQGPYCDSLLVVCDQLQVVNRLLLQLR